MPIKIIEKSRGRIGIEDDRPAKYKDFLGHDLTREELRLVPYIQYCAVNQQQCDRAHMDAMLHEGKTPTEIGAEIGCNEATARALITDAWRRDKDLNTTLLYGVSGTGKTTFGRYVAAMFELPFYYINFSRVIDSHLGSTGSNIAKVFDFVRYTPCVLMLDEIDTVSKRRDGGSNAEGELSRVTVTLMQEFDKLNGHQIVIGATNRIDLIDNALLRRFSMIHEVTVPEDAVEAARVARRLLDDIGEAYSVEEVIGFCEEHEGKPQSWIIGKTIEGIVRAIETGEPFTVEGLGD